MATDSELPNEYLKNVVKELIEKERFKNFTTTVSLFSNKGDNYLGDMYRIKVTGTKDSGLHDSLSIVLKVAPNFKNIRQAMHIDQYYSREVHAYSLLHPALEELQEELPESERMRFVRYYGGSIESGKEMVMMEDLAVDDFVMLPRLNPLDLNHTELALSKLAQYHALCLALKKTKPEVYKQILSYACKGIDMGPVYSTVVNIAAPRGVAVIKGDIYRRKVEEYCEGLYDKIEEMLAADRAEPYEVICHGDFRANNMLFKYKNDRPVDLRIVDWQIMRPASPVIDLAYMLFTTTEDVFRRKHWEHLLDHYYAALEARLIALGQGPELYPRAVFDEHVRTYMSFGLSTAIVLMPLMLCDTDNPFDIHKMLTGTEEGDDNKLSQTCINRLQGVVEFLVDKKLI